LSNTPYQILLEPWLPECYPITGLNWSHELVARTWKKRLAEYLRASGYAVTEEYPVGGGRTIDLVAERDGKRIAFEIETGKSDAAGNVQKCLDAGMDRVIVVAVTAGVQDKLARTLQSRPCVELRDGHEVLRVA